MVTGWLRAAGPHLAGAVLAAAIAAPWVPLGLWMKQQDVLPPLWVAFLSAPFSAAVAGWLMGPGTVRAGGGIRRIVGVAVLVVFINSFVVSAVLLLLELFRPHDSGFQIEWIALGLFVGVIYGLLGLVFLGWIAIVPALISGAIWVRILRRIFSVQTKLDVSG